jgi:hypothetical protein
MTNTATATGFESFHIPVERIEELTDRIAKVNRKADKLGLPHVTMIVTDNTQEHAVKVGGTIGHRYGRVISWTSREVLLKGETPKLNGWEFLTVVLHRPAGNEFVNVMDTTVDVSDYLFRDKVCDHCNKSRIRNATFLVKHENGTIKQVGSTCLEDYTGMKSPQAVAKHMENIFSMFRELRGGGWVQGRTSKKFFAAEWLAWVSAEMNDRGFYVSRNRAADQGGYTTGEMAKAVMLSPEPRYTPTDADYDRAERAIAWVRSEEGFNSIHAFSPDFALQLAAAVASDDATLGENAFNIVAPAIVMHERFLKDQAKPVSQHQGAVKAKLTVAVTVESQRLVEGQYGFSTVYNFRDAQGNLYVWFSSRDMKLEDNSTIMLTGTVKRHDLHYRTGESQTVLTRCKVV